MRRYWSLIDWTTSLTQCSKEWYSTALKATEMKSWIVWCRYDEKTCSLKILEVIFLNNDMKLDLHRCDESTTWLTEMKTRVSNSNRLQKSLFWTNWNQLNQRLKSDWSTRRTRKKYFYLYVVQALFKFFFCFFVKVWFFCCIATFAQNLLFENTEMTF